MPGSLAEGVSPAAMLVGDRGPRRWESWTVGRSDWWWVCTDEGRLRCATLSLLSMSWLSGPCRVREATGVLEEFHQGQLEGRMRHCPPVLRSRVVTRRSIETTVPDSRVLRHGADARSKATGAGSVEL